MLQKGKVRIKNIIDKVKVHGASDTLAFLIERLSYPFRDIFYGLLKKKISKDLIKKTKDITTMDTAIEFSQRFNYFGFSIEPLQNKEEFLAFYSLLKKKIGQVRYIIEIGTANGGTLFLWSRIVEEDSMILTVDIRKYKKWQYDIFTSFTNIHNNSVIRFISGDTKDPSTYYEACKMFKNISIDLLFIDGDHSQGGAKNDFEVFSKLVRKGGIVAFHDILPARGNGVPDFYDAIKFKYEHYDLKSKSKEWGGIGVIVI